MRKWALRVLALMATSLAVPLLVAPFPTSFTDRSGQVFVQFLPRPPVDAAAAARHHGAPVCAVAPDTLARFPEVEDVLTSLDSGETETYQDSDSRQWIAFQTEVCGGPGDVKLLEFDQSLILVRPDDPEPAPGAPRLAEFRYLGDLPAKDLPVITPDDLARLPDSQFAFTRTDGDPLGIPLEAWDELTADLFGENNSAQAFSFHGRPYAPHFEYLDQTVEGEVPGLKTGLWAAGLLLLALGVYGFKNLYPISRGVAVNPRWVAILWDGIVLAFSLLAGFLTADALLTHLFPVESLVNDDFGTAMGVFFFVFGIPVVSAFTTSFTTQTVFADASQIRIDGMSGLHRIRWEDLAAIEFADEYMGVTRAGVPLPSKLQRRLCLKTQNGDQFFINEPQVKSSQAALRAELLRNAPERWKAELRGKLNQW